jgi:hypothetical protein
MRSTFGVLRLVNGLLAHWDWLESLFIQPGSMSRIRLPVFC